MRFAEVIHWAREVMREIDIHGLPIDPLHVCEVLNILVIPFSETKDDGFFEAIGIGSIDDLDGFCYSDGTGNFVIFYDDARTPRERINFTIAHELGHIILGHMKNTTTRPRYMTNRKSDPREKEADRFAGELIRPPIPFVLTGCTRADDIQSVCNITYEAASVCSNLVQTMQRKRNDPYFFNDFRFYHEQFFNFIYAKYCGRCRHTFVSADAKFCPVCGNEHLQWHNERLPILILAAAGLEGQLVMKYKEYPVNEQNQVLRCIRCDNEDLRPEDRYCKICGAPVYNYCAGQYADVGYGDHELDPRQSCGMITLPSNARYCTSCGGISAFYHTQLLPHWESEAQENQNAEISPESAQYFDFLDEDPPF